jgi:hypothetical protein
VEAVHANLRRQTHVGAGTDHRTHAQAVAEDDLFNFWGNEAADRAAARGAQVYHGLTEAVEEELRLHKQDKAMARWTAQRAAAQWVAAPFVDRTGHPREHEGTVHRKPRCQWINFAGTVGPGGFTVVRTCTAAKAAAAGADSRRASEGISERALGGKKGWTERP